MKLYCTNWRQLMNGYVDAPNKTAFLNALGRLHMWPKEGNHQPANEFGPLAQVTINFFRYCPVFKLCLIDDNVSINVYNHSTFIVSLESLNPCDECATDAKMWGQMIGFGSDLPQSYLQAKVGIETTMYDNVAKSMILVRTGMEPKQLEYPLDKDGNKINHGSLPDMLKCPLQFMSKHALYHFILAHHDIKKDFSTACLQEYAKKIVELRYQLGDGIIKP